MKQKWTAFFAALGITSAQSSADGIFMKEEDVDKMNTLFSENTDLKAAVQSEKDLRIAAEDALNAATEKHSNELTAKDAEISKLNEDHTAAINAATERETALQTEIDKLKGTGSASSSSKPDPIAGGKAKMTANQRAAEKNAAALRGEDPCDEEEEEEIEEGAGEE